jgi:ketosteroid isomerase-like protein
VRSIYAVGNTVLIRFDGSATTTSGEPYRNRFLWMFRMKDGLVVEAEAFLDLVAYQRVIETNEPRAQ